MTGPHDDQKLVEQFQRGTIDERKEAFAALYQRHERAMRWYLTRMTKNPELATDITQESFMKALDALDNYRPKASFKTWLFQIATNTFRNYRKKKRPETGINEEINPSDACRPDEIMAKKETRQEVLDAVDGLSDTLRSALVLVQFEDMKYREAAHVLDISMSALKARMSRAYQQLRQELLEK